MLNYTNELKENISIGYLRKTKEEMSNVGETVKENAPDAGQKVCFLSSLPQPLSNFSKAFEYLLRIQPFDSAKIYSNIRVKVRQ